MCPQAPIRLVRNGVEYEKFSPHKKGERHIMRQAFTYFHSVHIFSKVFDALCDLTGVPFTPSELADGAFAFESLSRTAS